MVKKQNTPSTGTFNRFKLEEKLTNEEVLQLKKFYKEIQKLCSIEPDFFKAEQLALKNLTVLKKYYDYQ